MQSIINSAILILLLFNNVLYKFIILTLKIRNWALIRDNNIMEY